MIRRGLFVAAVTVGVGLLVFINYPQDRTKVTRFFSSDKHTFGNIGPVSMEQGGSQPLVKGLTPPNKTKVLDQRVIAMEKRRLEEERKLVKEERKKLEEERKEKEEERKKMDEEIGKLLKEKKKEEEEKKKEDELGRKSIAKKMEKEKIKLLEESTRIMKEKQEMENTRQQLEKTRLELAEQEKWLRNEMEQSNEVDQPRFEQYKKTSLNRTIANKTWDPYKPDRVINAASDRLKLKNLKGKNEGLWMGLDPIQIHKQWPGLLLDGEYVLREFLDPKDSRARGMEGHPWKIADMTDSGAEDRFYQLLTTNHMHCADKRRMGNYGDGGWDICVSGPYEPQEGCVVYSFGINNDFSFDDAMGQVYGCKVKSFDPSMKMGDHKRSEFVFFSKIGLGSADATNGQGWRLMSLDSILKQGDNTDKIIAFMKIDVDYNEWPAMEVILQRGSLKNVKQFAIEIHTSEVQNRVSTKYDFLRFYSILLGLQKQGFRQYHYHFNPYGRYTSKRSGKERTCCYELYFINLNFLTDS